MNYFRECTTIEEVKKTYKNLAKVNHPDVGGSVEVMQLINNEYHKICVLIAKGGGLTDAEAEAEILASQLYKDAIEKISHLNGIVIELVGAWIWVTGDTKQHKDTLKSGGFMFASKKIAWYFRTAEHKVKSRKNYSLDEIKTKYGSQLLRANSLKSLTNV